MWTKNTRFFATLGVTVGLSGASLDAQAAVPEEANELIQEAAHYGASPLSLAPLLDLSDLLDWMTAQDALNATERAKGTITQGYGKTYAQYLHLRQLLQNGDFEAAKNAERELGFVQGWALVGPFSNDGMSGFTTAYGPESEGFTSLDQQFDGRMEQVSWLLTGGATESGYYDLGEWISPAQTSVAYGLVECRFGGGEVFVESAIDGAYRLWVNGAPAIENPANLGGMLVRDRASVRVRRGYNSLLLKVASEDHALGWHVRIVDRQGRNAASDCRVPSTPVGPVSEGEFARPTTILDDLNRSAESMSDEDLASAAALLRTFHSHDAREPWESFSSRVGGAALSSRALVRLSNTYRDHWKAVEVLRAAWAKDRSIRTGIAALNARHEELGWSATEEAQRWLEELQAIDRNDVRVQAAEAKLKTYLGYLADAALQYDRMFESFGVSPMLCSLSRDAYRAIPDAERLLRNSELCDPRMAQGLGRLKARIARDLQFARNEAVDDLIARYEPYFRHRSSWHRMLGDIFAAWSRNEEAAQRYQAAAKLLPGDAQLLMAQAQVAIRTGDNAEAVSLLDRALVLQPQNRTARDLRQTLIAQAEQFYTPFRADRTTLRAIREGMDLESHDYGTLVDTRVVRVHANGLATKYIQRAWAIQTRTGADDLRAFSVGFSPDSELVDIVSVQIIRPDGSIRESFSSREVNPYSGPSSIYYDVRYRQLTFPQLEAGDILNVEYTVSDVAYRNIFDDYFGDIWFYQGGVPLGRGRFVVQAPEHRELFHHVKGEGVHFAESMDRGVRTLAFEVQNSAPIPRINSLPGRSETHGFVHVSTYNDWNDLARWYWNLIREQLVTSPEILDKVRELTAGVDDTREKVARIYYHVVRTVRYVGLEFGVHGFKPYRTTQCYSRRFGDCKDSASLIKVMLNAAGIDAHVVLIRTRDLGRLPQSPPSLAVFNHAIVYVPELDMYLDGTTPHNGIDELVGGDQGASALIILDGNGGRFVETPTLEAKLNESRTFVRFDSRENVGTFAAWYAGQTAASMRRSFETDDRRLDAINRWIANMVPGSQVRDLSFSDASRNDLPVEFIAEFEGGRWVQPRGEDLLILPFGREVLRVGERASTARREYPADLGVPERVVHSMEMVVPEGFEPAASYDGVRRVEQGKFGFLEMSVRFDREAQTLHVRAEYERHALRIDPEDWSEFREWTRTVERAVNEPFIFSKVGGAR